MSLDRQSRIIAMALRTPHRIVGFTVIELIVVIAIIAVLLSLVFVGMSGMRNAGARTESLNALRQMVGAYNAYSAEHRQHLMPGYVASNYIGQGAVNRMDLRVRESDIGALGSSSNLLDPQNLAGYVWRLAPYLDNAWHTLMTDYRDRGIVSSLQAEFDDGVFGPSEATGNQRGIASVPSFGLNSIFVGGDTSHGGDATAERHPWLHGGTTLDFTRSRRERERLAAVRFTEVRNPARLLVFGPTARADAAADEEHAPYQQPVQGTYLGYVELRPPYIEPVTQGDWSAWQNQQWRIGVGGRIEAGANLDYGGAVIGAGLPIVRWGRSEYPVANLDGSTVVENIGELSQDMRRWSPFATGLDLPGITP